VLRAREVLLDRAPAAAVEIVHALHNAREVVEWFVAGDHIREGADLRPLMDAAEDQSDAFA